MPVYLLKVTAVWLVLLLLFEAFFKSNGRFTANRLYLILSIAVGLLLPLITVPTNLPIAFSKQQAIGTTTAHAITTQAPVYKAVKATTATIPIKTEKSRVDILFIIALIYSIGVTLLLLKCAIELFKIAALLRRKQRVIINGHSIIITGKSHAPYSFAGYIFIQDPANYTPQELAYIIRHEAAHQQQKHWLDLWLTQLACITLWFHPLLWRTRYLLRLQHEYEADHIAADSDAYTYGHFLLQQALLNGVPSIAHSFHASPIKNRIAMLTKKQTATARGLKYLLLVPALLACTYLVANAQKSSTPTPKPNAVAAKAPTPTVQQPEAVTITTTEPANNITEPTPVKDTAKAQPTTPTPTEDDRVYENLKTPATYPTGSTDFEDYMKDTFFKLRKGTPDSAAYVTELYLIVDKTGKLIGFDAKYARPEDKAIQVEKYLHPYQKPEAALDEYMQKIINESPCGSRLC